MIRFNKKLYYKYFDLHRVSSFLHDEREEIRSYRLMTLIKESDSKDIDLSKACNLDQLGFRLDEISEISEFCTSRSILSIENYVNSKVPEWIKNIILPDFFDLKWLSMIFQKFNINSKEELYKFLISQETKILIGEDLSILYGHFVQHSDWKDFPIQYAAKYDSINCINKSLLGSLIRGNFHNHTKFSDGAYELIGLLELANLLNYEYIGISDHTQIMNGLTEDSIIEQHKIIDELNKKSNCKILKSAECEMLSDGKLDFSTKILENLDYRIIAIHTDICQTKKNAEYRIIKAIENQYSNILAHPSARIYKKKIELCVDMYKVIDACVANNVVLEINGDPERLDLDPKYIIYALNKGAMFTVDSDTHLVNSFMNINNAIKIASDYHIPAERCLNTMGLSELKTFFSKNNV